MSSISDSERDAAPKVRVLFISSDPSDASRLSLGEEQREVDQRLLTSALRDSFTLDFAPQVRIDELASTLLRFKPTIVHFGGHGKEEGELLFVNAAGKGVLADPTAIAALFEVIMREVPVRCVVLSACFSDVLADALSAHVDCVIGVPGPLRDKASVPFAGAFYEALGQGGSLRTAFDLAAAQVLLVAPGSPASQTIRVKAGVALESVRLVDDAVALVARAPRPTGDELEALESIIARAEIKDDDLRLACLAADPLAPTSATGSRAAVLRHLTGFSTDVSVPRLADFAQRLALTAIGARDALLSWAREHVKKHRGDAAALDERWKSLEASNVGRHCLMVVLDEDEARRFTLRAWLGREREAPSPVASSTEPVTLDGLVGAVDELLFSDAVFALLTATGARLLIELIVPLAGLVTVTAKSFAEADFARDHDVVVRWRERVYERVKRPPKGVRPGLWQRKWEHLKKGDAAWTTPAPEGLSRDECAAVALAPTAGSDERATWIATLERALQLGMPVVAWLSNDVASVDAPVVFETVTKATPADALSRALDARQQNKPDGSRYLALLWDDPGRLPPDARAAAQLAAPTRI